MWFENNFKIQKFAKNWNNDWHIEKKNTKISFILNYLYFFTIIYINIIIKNNKIVNNYIYNK